jgi:1-acyl-sn-glycerol-3-phosphate acyltransferase
MKNKWFINLFLGFTKLTGIIPAFLFFKPRVFVAQNAKRRLPKNCILVSNHKSLLDFVLYLVIFPLRTIHFLMAEVLYNKSKFFAFLLNSWGGIKVERDERDFSFVNESIEILDNGGAIGIFPEGRLPINNKPWPFTTSTAFIAMHSDAPIVPIYTEGNYGIFKRAKVCIGEPFLLTDYAKKDLNDGEQLTHLTKVLEEKVYALKTVISQKEKVHKLFSFKHFAMDMARIVCIPLIPILRIKRRTLNGEKYRTKIKGGAIIAANHTSFLDPFVVGVTFWYRRLHFLVAEIVMGGKLRSALLRGVGAIKIDRNTADIEAITKSVSKLKEGFLLSVFPQGQICKDDKLETVKSGAVLMAIRANVPIIPIYIAPRKHWYNTRTVIIGNTVYPKEICNKAFPNANDIEQITAILSDELNRCKAYSNTHFSED